MPRRPRIDMVGYYHIINRGVDRRVVYMHKLYNFNKKVNFFFIPVKDVKR